MRARTRRAVEETNNMRMATYSGHGYPSAWESSASAESTTVIPLFWPHANATSMRDSIDIRSLGSSAFSMVQATVPTLDSGSTSNAMGRLMDREPQGEMPLVGRTAILARPCDAASGLSNHQILLRSQIQVFQATLDDLRTHTRGRNKSIALGQVGIRCRYCAHLPAAQRQKGAVYFPASVFGLYQAAQNMNTTHIQCGLCQAMPESAKTQCSHALAAKGGSSGAGRKYWAQSAAEMGLVDTEKGIFFLDDLPMEVKLMDSITSGIDDGMTRKRKA
jgi:hypothetical protein